MPPLQHTGPCGIPRDFFIIDAHLKKAHESSETACRLHSRGQFMDAIAQNKLTRVFLHNALARLERQCEDAGLGHLTACQPTPKDAP